MGTDPLTGVGVGTGLVPCSGHGECGRTSVWEGIQAGMEWPGWSLDTRCLEENRLPGALWHESSAGMPAASPDSTELPRRGEGQPVLRNLGATCVAPALGGGRVGKKEPLEFVTVGWHQASRLP